MNSIYTHNNCLIIFTGFNQRALIAFIRTIELYKLKYALVAKSGDDSILLTQYKSKVAYIRKSVVLDLDDILYSLTIVKNIINADKYIIAPSTEALNRFLLKNRNLIEDSNIIIPLVSKDLYESISDKYSFTKICERNDIKVPYEYRGIERAVLPFVAKPLRYFSLDGQSLSPVILLNDKSKKDFLQKFNPNDFYYQKYINGECYYLLYYFHRNGEVLKFSQLNLIQQPDGKSMVAAVSSKFHESNESIKYELLFKKMKFHGLVMIEVKQKNQNNYMIEANPRFWGPSQLFVDAGINLFDGFLHDYGFIKDFPQIRCTKKLTKYFWFGGINEILKMRQNLLFHKGSLINLMLDLPKWLEYDIYRRQDTIEIYLNEF